MYIADVLLFRQSVFWFPSESKRTFSISAEVGCILSTFFSSFFVLHTLEPPVKPYIVWNFDESLEDWANDLSNWAQKWEIIDGAICLHNIPAKPKLFSNRKLRIKAEDTTSRTAKASFWSPPIPQDIGLQCLSLEYRITAASDDMLHTSSLAVLQQQDG